MKKTQYLLCAAMFCVILFGAAQASYAGANTSNTIVFTLGSNQYSANGKEYSMDVTPVVVSGRTMLPIKYVANALGINDAGISWDATSKVVALDGTNIRIFVKVGDLNLYTLDSQSNINQITMDVAPTILNNRTYLPAKYVAEALGYHVTWDAADNRVIITGSGQVNSTDSGSGSKTYHSTVTGLSFSYPAAWLAKPYKYGSPTFFQIVNPADGSVLATDVLPAASSNPLPLDALGKLLLSQLNNTTPQGYTEPITNVTIVSTQNIEIDHLPAAVLTFTATTGFINEKSQLYLTQSGQNVYFFAFEGTIDTFDKDQATWGTVMNSVVITKAGMAT